jgi:hypothetical protein
LGPEYGNVEPSECFTRISESSIFRSTRVICAGERLSMEHNKDFPEPDKPMKDHSRFQDTATRKLLVFAILDEVMNTSVQMCSMRMLSIRLQEK